MASRDDAAGSPASAPRRPGPAPKDGGLLSPRFRSAAALAGWDEESVLLAALVVEDTPVRESRRKRRLSATSSARGSAGSSATKRRSRRQAPVEIPPVVLALDDDEKPNDAADGTKEGKEKDTEKVVAVAAEKEAPPGSGEKAEATGKLPCMDRLREELSCAICLEICFEPSTTPCGHSFCMKCLKHAAAKCGKRCPKCRQLISSSRSCTINTVLWNTIQLLFPSEVEARRTSIGSSSSCNGDINESPPSNNFPQGGMRTRNGTSGSFVIEGRTRSSHRSFVAPTSNTRSSSSSGSFITTHAGGTRGSNSRPGFVPASQLVGTRSSVRPDQSNDAALAYRLQQEEFMNAFETEEMSEVRSPQNTVSTARANLRAMASRAIRLRARGWPV
ncbi:hypothetical protein ACP4OV_003536 [Aristida adscensionis]